MIGKLATLIGYRKAPKATFVAKHPVKGTAALLAIHPKRTVAGLGAAALALPLGVWYARRRNGASA
ncbi:MAG: hypothetical protein ACRELV_04085 [Longimicrobiales bacterium]